MANLVHELSLGLVFMLEVLKLIQTWGSSESAPSRLSLKAIVTKPLPLNTDGENWMSKAVLSPVLVSNRQFVLAVLRHFCASSACLFVLSLLRSWQTAIVCVFATRASAIQDNRGCTLNTSAEPGECGCAVSLLAPCTLWVRRWSAAGGSGK